MAKAQVSLRRAINDKCKDCTYDEQAAGTWRAQVTACPCIECPLWLARPTVYEGDPSPTLLAELAEDIPADLVRRIWTSPYDPSPWREARTAQRGDA